MKKIDESLKKYAMRLRFARALRGTAIGALVGSAAATVLAMLDRSGAFYASWAMLAACFATSAVAGALVGFVLRVDKSTLADSVDRRLGLRDRLRSSLENEEGDFHRAVIADTESQLSKLGNKNAFPLRLSRWHGAAILGMMFACGIFLLGNTPLFLSDAERAEREDLKVHAEQIRKVAKPIIDRDEVSTAEERELAERLEKLAKDLERGRMSKKEALAEANKLSERADELAKQRNINAERTMTAAEAMRRQADQRKLEAAGLGKVDMDDLAKSDEQLAAEADSLSKQIAEIEKQLAGDNLSKEERDALESELESAKNQLQNIELSQKAKEFLERLYSHPAYKELMEMAKKLNQSATQGGGKQLTKEQIEEMIKRLEELSDQLKDDEDLRAFIEEMKKALKECQGACNSLGLGLGLAGLMPGQGGRSQDHFFSDTDQINMNKDERDIDAKSEQHGVRGERGDRGTETHIEVMGPSASGERTKTPYTSVLPKYKKSAESAIDRQQIPKSQQKRVRDYFDSLSGGK